MRKTPLLGSSKLGGHATSLLFSVVAVAVAYGCAGRADTVYVVAQRLGCNLVKSKCSLAVCYLYMQGTCSLQGVWWNAGCSPVLPFQPKYRLVHPENCLFLSSNNVFIRSKYPKKIDLILKKTSVLFTSQVTAPLLLSHIMPALMSGQDELTQASLSAIHAVCSMPMPPRDRQTLQHQLLQVWLVCVLRWFLLCRTASKI